MVTQLIDALGAVLGWQWSGPVRLSVRTGRNVFMLRDLH